MVEEYDSDFGEDIEEDDREEETEEQMDLQTDISEDMSPSPVRKDDLYSLFRWIISKKDSSKVGNLSVTELGMLDITVRDMQKIALIAESLGHRGFATFFRNQAEITLATSSSKDGWLPELFVSQRKIQQKSRRYNVQNLQPLPQKKKGLFKR